MARVLREGTSLLFWVPLSLLGVGDAIAVVLAAQGDATVLDIMLPVTLIIVTGCWWFFWGRGRLNGWQQRRSDTSLQYPIHHIMSDNGLRVRGRSAEVTMGWRSMNVIETKGFVLFYTSSTSAYFLPKRVATAEQLDELRGLIRANTRGARLFR